MARSQVNYGQERLGDLRPDQRRIADPGLRPAATVVDSFIRPVNTTDGNVGAKAAQLASALTQFAPKLGQFAAGLQQRSNDKNLQEGQLTASELAREGLSFKEAVESGKLPRNKNPFFIAGAREQFGRVAADRMHTDLSLLLGEQLKDESDPGMVAAALDDAQRTWIANNVGENKDSHFQTGFSLRAAQHMEATRATLLERAGKNLETQSDSAVFAEARKHIVDTARSMPIQEVATDLNQLREDLLRQGRSAIQVDRAMLKAVGEAMLEKGAPDVSALFDLVKGSNGLSLRDVFGDKSSEYARGIAVAHNAQWREARRQETEDKRIADDNATEVASREVLSTLLADPRADIRAAVEKVKHIPGAVEELLKARQTATAVTQYEDPDVERDLFTGIWTGTVSVKDVITRLNRGGLSVQTANRMVGEIDQRDGRLRSEARAAASEGREVERHAAAKRREYRDLVSDPLLTKQLSSLRAQFKDPSQNWLTKDAAARADNAQAHLMRAWVLWKDSPEGMTAAPAETIEWLNKQSVALAGDLNTVVGSKYSGVKAPLKPLSASDGAAVQTPKVPMVMREDIESTQRTGRPTEAMKQAMRKAGIPPEPAAMAKFIREQEALLNPKR